MTVNSNQPCWWHGVTAKKHASKGSEEKINERITSKFGLRMEMLDGCWLTISG